MTYFDLVAVSGGLVNGLVSVAVGLFMCVSYGLMIFTVATRLLDPLIRMILALAAAPVAVGCYAFPSTRPITVALLRMLFGCVIYLLVTGVVFSVAFFLVVVGIALDTGQLSELSGVGFGQRFDLEQMKEWILRNPPATSGGKLDIAYPLMNLVMSFLATSVIGQTPQIAGQISGSSFQGGIGDQVSQQAQTAVSHAGAFALRGASVAGSGVANLFRR